MSLPGNWTLYFDWNSTGTYGNTPMTIAANNTWTNGEGYKGTWSLVSGVLMFQFEERDFPSSQTTYAGIYADKSVTGSNSTFDGLSGSFYMLEAGAAGPLAAHAHNVADSHGARKPH